MLAARIGHKDIFTWYVGDPPIKEKIDPFSHLYVEVMADGQELDHIKTTFRGLPFHASKVLQTWYGDHAKFILGNLR